MTTWHKIDTAPIDEPIIAWDKRNGVYYEAEAYYIGDKLVGWRCPKILGLMHPTHWTELIEPPKVNK